MAYHELIKNFNKIRTYMRDFYVYGFKNREDFTQKSRRSYDDERRRVESWLGRYMQFRSSASGKRVFLSIDSRQVKHNPLFEAWKTRSFTNADITLHFLFLEVLSKEPLTFRQINERIMERMSVFETEMILDESTIRKKLKEYTEEGIVICQKEGRMQTYRFKDEIPELPYDALHFFSETSPCGVVGSFLSDRQKSDKDILSFQHHYITAALDSEILYGLLEGIRHHREVIVQMYQSEENSIPVVPLLILVGVSQGRQYLLGYEAEREEFCTLRIDRIERFRMGERNEKFEQYEEELKQMRKHMWGVNPQNRSHAVLQKVSFTVHYTRQERYIPQRLEREKRCGSVTHLDENTSRFTAEVYDVQEMIPWIRTFLCRITDLSISDRHVRKQFEQDLKQMYALYGLQEYKDDIS